MEYEEFRDLPERWGLTNNGLWRGRFFYHPLKLNRYWQEFITWWTSLSCQVAEPQIYSDKATFNRDTAAMCAVQRDLPLVIPRTDPWT